MNFTLGTTLLTACVALFTLTVANAAEPEAVDSKESYRLVLANPSNTSIIDVRTKAEYLFVGHPDMPNGVPNIPLKFFPGWEMNPEFVAKVSERYKKDDTLILMCRSGARAEAAAKMLSKAGFTNTLYMDDSFEGQTGKDGHRTVNGWKVNNLPYTYNLDPGLVYK